jgi:hypothetical protein
LQELHALLFGKKFEGHVESLRGPWSSLTC